MWVYLVWRFGHGRTGVGRSVYRLLAILVIRSRAGTHIPAKVTLGERVWLMHDAQGIVIHPRVVVGDDVVIYHQVTIGSATNRPGAPTIGNGVVIGAGAKILGPVCVSEGARDRRMPWSRRTSLQTSPLWLPRLDQVGARM